MEERFAVVSVVVPTYHRPAALRDCVAAVLRQELPAGTELEVAIAVSDPAAAADLEAAMELAADPRVRVATAERPGPAAARNAGIRAARGEALAFIDDDCRPRAGWLEQGLLALAGADLVQGRTVAMDGRPGLAHAVNVAPLSWLWEGCNLFCRAEIARSQQFDQDWNPTGREGGHSGEDTEWGWRVVRAGARAAAAPGAVVEHEVRSWTLREDLAYQFGSRHLPALFRVAPEARGHFTGGYFLTKRHIMLAGAATLLTAGAAAAVAGQRGLGRLALGAGAAVYLSGFRGDVEGLLSYALGDAVLVGSAILNSARSRRLVL
ncbi:MAG: glycosyltransferase family 2 protein [Candidatus Dormibacteria bacterium]